MMRIEKYISFVYADEEEELESPFQYRTEHPRAYYENNIEALRDELNKHFWFIFYQADLERSDKEDYLEYHLDKYTGHEMNFMDFVRVMPMLPMEVNDCVVIDYGWRVDRRSYLSDWIEKRQEEAGKREGISKTLQAPPEMDDHRLQVLQNGKLVDASEVREWFRKELLLKKFNGKPIISSKDFDAFLYASFANFETAALIPADRKLVVNADGAFLKNLVYRFYLAYRQSKKDKALKSGLTAVLKNTFVTFKDQEELTIHLSMHRVYKPRTN